MPSESESDPDSIPEMEDPIPSWLKPYMPIISTGIEKLLGGGVQGMAAKTILLGSDEFIQIFSDPERWAQAVQALTAMHGSDKIQKVVSILEAARKPEPIASPSKPKK